VTSAEQCVNNLCTFLQTDNHASCPRPVDSIWSSELWCSSGG